MIYSPRGIGLLVVEDVIIGIVLILAVAFGSVYLLAYARTRTSRLLGVSGAFGGLALYSLALVLGIMCDMYMGPVVYHALVCTIVLAILLALSFRRKLKR